NWETTYVSTEHNYDATTDTMDPSADPYARVNPFNPCKPVYSQTCHLHPPFGAYKNEDWAFPRSQMATLPPPGNTPWRPLLGSRSPAVEKPAEKKVSQFASAF